jgi:hypothetical protein
VRRLRRTSEWLLPLAALDVLLAAFLLAQRGPSVGTYADQVHAGFWQLLAVTALVLLVVAGTVRFVPRSAGVLAALAVLCVLTVVVDGSALSRLDAYTDAYGLTPPADRRRRRLPVTGRRAAAGPGGRRSADRRRRRWRHAVAADRCVLPAVADRLEPGRQIVRSAAAAGAQADVDYLGTLSADAVPAVRELPRGLCTRVLTLIGPCRTSRGPRRT